MRQSSSSIDVLQTVTKRRPLLECLESGPRDKQALCAALEWSRSTIDRGIRELEWLQFVERDGCDCRLTAAGRLALTEHRRSTTILDSISDVSELLKNVPREAPMSTALLDGAQVIEPPSHAPTKPLQAVVDLVGSATRMRSITAAQRVPQLREQLYDRVVKGDLDGEAVVTPEFATFLREEDPEHFREVVIEGGFDLYTIESIPYELVLIETPTESRVFTFVLDDSTAIQGIISNDTTAALEWGEHVYTEFRTAATALLSSA